MRRLGVFAVALAALAVPAPAGAARAGLVRTTPGVLDLMKLRGHAFALVQVPHGTRVPGAVLVSRRLGVWRLPTARAQRLALGLKPLAVEPDRELAPQRATEDTLAGLEWWRGAISADRVAPPGPGKRVTVIDTASTSHIRSSRAGRTPRS